LSKSTFTGQQSGHPFLGVTVACATVHSEAHSPVRAIS
jgi:hypothetical protein